MSEQVGDADRVQNGVPVERKGDRELSISRTFDAPPGTVYRTWSEGALFRLWWFPRSVSGVSLVACEMDARTGGQYRLEFAIDGADTMAFHGRYIEVAPNARIVWTNDEGDEGAITTVTFEDRDGRTLLNFQETYPSRDALEEALAGSASALPEQLDQLAELLSGMER